MYVNNIEPEMVLPPGSESFNHNATRTTSSRSRSNNVNNNTVCVYTVDFLTAGACIITVYRNCYSDASSIAVGVYSVTFMCCDTIRDQRFRK